MTDLVIDVILVSVGVLAGLIFAALFRANDDPFRDDEEDRL